MKRCPKCKGGNPDVAAVCKNCGAPFTSAGEQPVPASAPPTNPHPDRVANRHLILWVVGVLVALGLFLLLYFAVIRPAGDPARPDPLPGVDTTQPVGPPPPADIETGTAPPALPR